MSLATLKKKSQVKYGKISSSASYKNNPSNYQGFSLNNLRRVANKRGKSQYQTPMRGTAPRGHGSTYGEYPVNIIKSQYVNYDSFERITEYKSTHGISVKGNKGSLNARFKWMKSGYPNSVVKDMEPLTTEQLLHELRICHSDDTRATASDAIDVYDCDGGSNDYTGDASTKNKCARPQNQNVYKKVKTLSQGEYLDTVFLKKHCLPTTASNAPYPKPISGSCNSCADSDACE